MSQYAHHSVGLSTYSMISYRAMTCSFTNAKRPLETFVAFIVFVFLQPPEQFTACRSAFKRVPIPPKPMTMSLAISPRIVFLATARDFAYTVFSHIDLQ